MCSAVSRLHVEVTAPDRHHYPYQHVFNFEHPPCAAHLVRLFDNGELPHLIDPMCKAARMVPNPAKVHDMVEAPDWAKMVVFKTPEAPVTKPQIIAADIST